MSIITKQPSEFHSQIPNQSSTTIKDLPVKQQQQHLVQDTSNQKPSVETSLSNTDYPRSQADVDFYENLLTNKDVFGNISAEKNVSEDFAENVSKHDAVLNENVTCKRTLNDKRIFHTDNTVESTFNGNPKEVLLTDKSLFKSVSEEQKSLDKAPKVITTVTKHVYSAPNISQDLNRIPSWNYQHSKCYIKQEVVPVGNLSETNSLQFDRQSDDVDEKEDNFCDVKQDTEQFNVLNDDIDTKSHEDPLSSVLEPQDDGHGRKSSLNLLHREELNRNYSFRNEDCGTKHSDFTSLISSQRETILKLRREERLSEERTVESKSKQDSQIKNIKPFEPGDIRKPNMSTDSISSTHSEKSKHKKLKKKHVDYSGINDLFSEPLNVKQFYFDRNKREKKIPSKFLYLSKMEKYLSHGPKNRHKKKSKSKHNHADELTTKIKCDRKENIKECVKSEPEPGVKEVNKIKIFTMKDEDTGVLRKHIKVKEPEQSYHRFSGSRSSSKSSTSPFKKSLLRDVHFHQHCRRRYYRLKQANWNCSSRGALHLLKRKYNSIKLLFDREPTICLERLNLKEPHVQSIIKTCNDGSDIKSESIKINSPWTGKVKAESETLMVGSKVQKSLTQEHGFNGTSENENLVDPRVMSLSRTLQSTNSGKVGLEKIFKNYSSKPFKSKKKESNSKSHSNSVKKKAKPDWSKWKEKLKEASNRMVERKKSGLVIEKSINTFPNSYIKNSPPSILHFRIPLKSSNKVKTEDNKALNEEIKSDADNVECDSSSKDILERDALKLDMKTAKVSENEDAKNVLKEINEELTLEEFESDKAITYSINGYSIEISRDSPIDIRMNDNKTSVKSECFDEDEMDKILYGDNLDDVSLDCHNRNIQEHFNDTDAGLTVTSDIIPNLCAQDVFFQTDNDMDKSPPVLERSEYKTENSDDENKNTYIVQINNERLETEKEEMIEEDAEYCDSKNETFHSDNECDVKKEMVVSVNQDEIEVKMESGSEVSYDERVDKSPSSIASSDALSVENFIIQEGSQPVSDSDGEDEIFNSPPFVIENVCSLSEDTHGRVENLDKKANLDKKESDYESEGDTETCEISSSGSVKLIENEAEKPESVDKLTLPMTQKSRDEAQGEVDFSSGLMEDILDMKCNETNVKFKESLRGSMSKETKASFQSQSKSNENILNDNTSSGERKSNDVQAEENFETVQSSKTTCGNRGNDKAPEKSAAAVMEDLEKMWREMTAKPEIENVSIKETAKVNKGDLTEGIKYINEKVCNIANSIVFRKCASKEWTAIEAFKKISETQEDSSKDIRSNKDTFIDNNAQKQIDSEYNLKTAELDSKTQTVSAKPDLNIEVINSQETNGSEARNTSTPISSIDYDMETSDNKEGIMRVADLVENHEEFEEDSEPEYGTKETEVTSSTGDKAEDAATREVETSEIEQMKKRKRKISSGK